jgi:hypothetical protein
MQTNVLNERNVDLVAYLGVNAPNKNAIPNLPLSVTENTIATADICSPYKKQEGAQRN